MEFSAMRNRYWGKLFGRLNIFNQPVNVTADIISQNLELHF